MKSRDLIKWGKSRKGREKNPPNNETSTRELANDKPSTISVTAIHKNIRSAVCLIYRSSMVD